MGDTEPVYVFILGAPRSGTSWLQKELGLASGAAVAPELHAFADVLGHAYSAWMARERVLQKVVQQVAAGQVPSDRLIGLPAALEEEDYTAWLRDLFSRIVRASDASAQVFIEKTPSNSLFVPLVRMIFPSASFVHVVRDPRDVVRSLRAISHSEWGKWAPRSALVGALMWRSHTTGAAEAHSLANCEVVRYEDLKANPVLIRDVARRLQIERPQEPLSGAGRIITSSAVRFATRNGHPTEPSDFGTGKSERASLSSMGTWIVEFVCADMMRVYDYTARFPTAESANRVLLQPILSVVHRRVPRGLLRYGALRLQRHDPRVILGRMAS